MTRTRHPQGGYTVRVGCYTLYRLSSGTVHVDRAYSGVTLARFDDFSAALRWLRSVAR